MKVLLDSHALLWAAYSPEVLPTRVIELLEDETNELVVSLASLWELLSKIGRGKLLLAGSSVETAFQRFMDLGISVMPVELAHIVAASRLPPLHYDPFDRVIIVQALAEGLPIVTSDRIFPMYGVEVIWK